MELALALVGAKTSFRIAIADFTGFDEPKPDQQSAKSPTVEAAKRGQNEMPDPQE
jgi:hypothetical protein